jgi:hypothetical protein
MRTRAWLSCARVVLLAGRAATVMVAFFGKIFVAAYESALRKRGTSLLTIRKLSNTIAATFQTSGLFAFSFCKTYGLSLITNTMHNRYYVA